MCLMYDYKHPCLKTFNFFSINHSTYFYNSFVRIFMPIQVGSSPYSNIKVSQTLTLTSFSRSLFLWSLRWLVHNQACLWQWMKGLWLSWLGTLLASNREKSVMSSNPLQHIEYTSHHRGKWTDPNLESRDRWRKPEPAQPNLISGSHTVAQARLESTIEGMVALNSLFH